LTTVYITMSHEPIVIVSGKHLKLLEGMIPIGRKQIKNAERLLTGTQKLGNAERLAMKKKDNRRAKATKFFVKYNYKVFTKRLRCLDHLGLRD